MNYRYTNSDGTSAEPSPLLVTKKVLAKRYSVCTRKIQTWVNRRIIPFIRMSGGIGRGLLLFNPKATDAALHQFGGVKELPITMMRRKLAAKPRPANKTAAAKSTAVKAS